jgi:hypothetical protein
LVGQQPLQHLGELELSAALAAESEVRHQALRRVLVQGLVKVAPELFRGFSTVDQQVTS